MATGAKLEMNDLFINKLRYKQIKLKFQTNKLAKIKQQPRFNWLNKKSNQSYFKLFKDVV